MPPTTKHARRRGDRGQALPLVIGVLAVMAVVLSAVAWFAGTTIDAARARTAADAAALAGVVGGAPEASRVADSNAAALLDFRREGSDVIVTVRVGRATATARATSGGTGFSTLDRRDRSTG
jgi:hypothetical protein